MTRLAVSARRIATAALLTLTPGAALAQADYPNRTIRIVVPLPPPGGPDTVARLVADKLAAKWGQTVIVENRPGGGLNIGAQAVANANPDGYTLLVTPPGPLVTHQQLFAKLGFAPGAFVPVSILVKFPFVLAARAGLPVSTLAELVTFAKANPEKLNIAHSGRGGPPHLMAEMLQARAGIRLVHVPYTGLGQAQTDLLAGQVDMLFHDTGNTMPHVKTGKVKVLGVTGETRLAEFPDVPAIAEAYPGFLAISWFAVVAPPKTSPEIAEKLSRAIGEAMQSPDVVNRLAAFSMTPVGTSPAEAATFVREETERWRNVIISAGITPQ
jgi:tripartite-type tricarboxylate transporter receptor subunit TctC